MEKKSLPLQVINYNAAGIDRTGDPVENSDDVTTRFRGRLTTG